MGCGTRPATLFLPLLVTEDLVGWRDGESGPLASIDSRPLAAVFLAYSTTQETTAIRSAIAQNVTFVLYIRSHEWYNKRIQARLFAERDDEITAALREPSYPKEWYKTNQEKHP